MTIGCYHGTDELHAMTRIAIVDGGAILATYANGSSMLLKSQGDQVPVLQFDIGDEPVVHLKSGPLAVETPSAVIEAAFNAWLSTAVCALDPEGHAFSIHQLNKNGLVLRASNGDNATMPKSEDGKLLSVVWNGNHLIGFAYGTGTPLVRANGSVNGAEIERIRDRLKIIKSRLRGEWRIVAGEGERLGTDTTELKVGCHVKIGIQPVHAMPEDIHAEWMWAKVTKINGEDITATLANEPSMFEISPKHGDKIRFKKRDIYAVEEG